MVFIKECDFSREMVEPKTNAEICEYIWCFNSLARGDGKVDWRFVETKMLGGYESWSSDIEQCLKS